MEITGWIATGLAVVGVLLNNQLMRSCFYFWLISNAISCGLHIAVCLWSLAVRDALFFAFAIFGLLSWSKKQDRDYCRGFEDGHQVGRLAEQVRHLSGEDEF